MVTFVGLPDQETEDRDAFQEIDTKGLFGTFVKWSAVIRDVRRVPEYVSRAFHAAVMALNIRSARIGRFSVAPSLYLPAVTLPLQPEQ